MQSPPYRLPWVRYLGWAEVVLFAGAFRILVVQQPDGAWIATATGGSRAEEGALFYYSHWAVPYTVCLAKNAESRDTAMVMAEEFVRKHCAQLLTLLQEGTC